MIAHALLFDLDGTLTDPKPGIVGCLRFALDQLGVACPSDDVLATFIGPPLRGTFAMLLDTSEVFRIEEAVRWYRQRFAATGLYENQVYAGVPAMLEHAKQAATAMYVVTSKPAVYAERIVQHFGLDHHFRQVYGAELDGRSHSTRSRSGVRAGSARRPCRHARATATGSTASCRPTRSASA